MSGALAGFFGSAEDDWLHPAVHAATKQQQPSPGLPQSAECWSRPTKRVTVGGTTNLVKKLRGSRTRQKQERSGNKHWIVRFEQVDNEASRDRGIAPSGLRVGDCLTAGAFEGRYFVTTSSAADGVGKRVAAQGFPVRVFDPIQGSTSVIRKFWPG